MMKKLIFAAVPLLFIACSGSDKQSKTDAAEQQTEMVNAKKYACPMQCEGDKTYPTAGTCPVCKMDLQEVALAETDSTGHTH
jgi:hypothetical protein